MHHPIVIPVREINELEDGCFNVIVLMAVGRHTTPLSSGELTIDVTDTEDGPRRRFIALPWLGVTRALSQQRLGIRGDVPPPPSSDAPMDSISNTLGGHRGEFSYKSMRFSAPTQAPEGFLYRLGAAMVIDRTAFITRRGGKHFASPIHWAVTVVSFPASPCTLRLRPRHPKDFITGSERRWLSTGRLSSRGA